MIQNLIIPSDNNELKYVRTIKTKTSESYEYEYTKSEVQLGKLIQFEKSYFEKLLRSEIIKDANK